MDYRFAHTSRDEASGATIMAEDDGHDRRTGAASHEQARSDGAVFTNAPRVLALALSCPGSATVRSPTVVIERRVVARRF
jgi:hypothetical protein